MIDANAISLVAQGLRTSLAQGLSIDSSQVLIGSPASNATTAQNQTGLQYLNLFFFRADYGGYSPSAGFDDPIYLRVFCLITAFGNDETDGELTVTAGENDLRLVGGVAAHLHQAPVIRVEDDQAREVAQLQVVIAPMTNDDINNIWSTQSDTSYRLSLAYEIALVPAPLSRPLAGANRVGSIGLGLFSGDDMSAESQRSVVPGSFLNGSSPSGYAMPAAHRVRTHTADGSVIPGWVPHLLLANDDDQLSHSMTFEIDQLPVDFSALLLGLEGEPCDLILQRWDNAEGWLDLVNPGIGLTAATDRLDPRCFNPALISSAFAFPFNAIGQYQLFATRSYSNLLGETIQVRSNPVLITVAPASPDAEGGG